MIPAADRLDRVVGEFCLELDAALRRHNSSQPGARRLRLRLAMDEGLVSPARNGFAGRTVVAVSRLVSAAASREALLRHPSVDLVVVLSDWVYADWVYADWVYADWVCSGRATVRADLFHQVVVTEKEYTAVAWLWLPGAGQPEFSTSVAPPAPATVKIKAPFLYGRRARLAPAVLVTLPPVVLGLFLLPVAGPGVGALVILAGVVVLPLLAAQVARDHGRRVQMRLFRQWGGRPTEVMLRWHGAEAPEVVARRHQLIARHLGFALPDEKAELDDPERADHEYAAAVAALREDPRHVTAPTGHGRERHVRILAQTCMPAAWARSACSPAAPRCCSACSPRPR
ncbi:hypothetical protein [Actinoplanes awajinensis]|uniref:Uncharacterized protein n=1 Tax=Actinoplanes awajinensis subsp. mycoplanecinus TaxID=135947 RepID=A0A101J7E9_9ACTN|nr:hypothetical protein [Actinoplanes awajinensis]KUL21593.1 hypothetical protein ADL15_50385 [Actinoplanes awajinensis subsp. mycoplanecinus]